MESDRLLSHWQDIRAGLLATIDKFANEQLSYAPFDGAWSVARLMLHIAHEEEGEFRYGVTRELAEWPAEYRAEDYPTKESIKALLTEVHNGTETYLRTLNEPELDRVVETPWGKNIQLGSMLFHILAHEIHHRGELSLILGLLGREGLDA